MVSSIDDKLDELAAENSKNEALYPELANASIDYCLHQQSGYSVLSMNLSAQSQDIETDNYLGMVLDLVLAQGPLYIQLSKTFPQGLELADKYKIVLTKNADLIIKDLLHLEGLAYDSEHWHEIITLLSYKFSSEDLLLMGLLPHLVDNDPPFVDDSSDYHDWDDEM